MAAAGEALAHDEQRPSIGQDFGGAGNWTVLAIFGHEA
jgi:hypothetical protein